MWMRPPHDHSSGSLFGPRASQRAFSSRMPLSVQATLLHGLRWLMVLK